MSSLIRLPVIDGCIDIPRRCARGLGWRSDLDAIVRAAFGDHDPAFEAGIRTLGTALGFSEAIEQSARRCGCVDRARGATVAGAIN